MHKLPRLNGCGVSSERQYCLLSADEIFLRFNEPFFGNISLTKLLSYGDVLAWLRKNTSLYRKFQERYIPNLPRLNGCGVSNERQYCSLSADEIFFKNNEPFFRNASFNIDRSCHIAKSGSSICYLFSMFPGTPDAKTAAAKWLRGIKWKAILFAICWRNIFQF